MKELKTGTAVKLKEEIRVLNEDCLGTDLGAIVIEKGNIGKV